MARRKPKQRPQRLKAPSSDYTDADGNALTLRGALTPATRREYAEVLAGDGGRAASTREDTWQRAVELLFERLAVRWEIAGAPIERQRELLARFAWRARPSAPGSATRCASTARRTSPTYGRPTANGGARRRRALVCMSTLHSLRPGLACPAHVSRRTSPPATVRAMRRTKIVATIGPASREPETLLRMVQAGMDVARLNYSHGTLEEHAETIRRVRDAAGRAGRPVAILQDLPGPKLRIGPLREDVVELKPGDRVTFDCSGEDGDGDAGHMTISWPGLAEALEPDAVIYLADGSVRLRVRDARPAVHEVEAEVEIGGAVASRQG